MTPATPAQPRNTERCPQCGYLLEGLPDSGQCPECGYTYDQSLIVIDGWLTGRGASANTFASRRPSALLGLLASNTITAVVLFNILQGNMRWLGLLPIVVPILCYIVARKNDEDEVPPLQLILDAQGYILRPHPAARSMVMLQYFAAASIILPLAAMMATNSPRMLFVFIGGYVGSFVIAAAAVYIRKRTRLRTCTTPSGQSLTLISWEPKYEVLFERLRGDTWRIIIGQEPKKRRSFRLTSAVENILRVEADLSDQRVEHIIAQIGAWPVKVTVSRELPKRHWWQRRR